MVYEVAPGTAVQETLIWVCEMAVAVTPVGAAGGVQGPVEPSMPSTVVAPVLPASSQFERRVLLVPPPVQETLNRP